MTAPKSRQIRFCVFSLNQPCTCQCCFLRRSSTGSPTRAAPFVWLGARGVSNRASGPQKSMSGMHGGGGRRPPGPPPGRAPMNRMQHGMPPGFPPQQRGTCRRAAVLAWLVMALCSRRCASPECCAWARLCVCGWFTVQCPDGSAGRLACWSSHSDPSSPPPCSSCTSD